MKEGASETRGRSAAGGARRGAQWALRLLGLVLLAVLLWRADMEQVWGVLRSLQPLNLVLALILVFPLVALKALRWRLIISHMGGGVPFREAYLLYLAGIFWGVLTPGRVGEFFKAQQIVPWSSLSLPLAVASVLADRVLDLMLLLLVGWGAMVGLLAIPWWAAALLVVAPALAALVAVPMARRGRRRMQQRRDEGAHSNLVGRALGWLGEMLDGLLALDGRTVWRAALLTVGAYGVFFFQGVVLARGVGIQAAWHAVVRAVGLGAVVGLLPISIAGLGTRDAAVVAYLRLFQVPVEISLGFSLAFSLVFSLWVSALGGLAQWMFSGPRLAAEREGSGR